MKNKMKKIYKIIDMIHYKKRFIMCCILISITVEVPQILYPFLNKELIECSLNQEWEEKSLWVIVGYLVSLIISFLLRIINEEYDKKFDNLGIYGLKIEYIKKQICSLKNDETGKFYINIDKGIEQTVLYIKLISILSWKYFTWILINSLCLFLINFKLSIPLIIFIPLTIYVGKIINKKFVQSNKKIIKYDSELIERIVNLCESWKDIKGFLAEYFYLDGIIQILNREKKEALRWIKMFGLEKIFYKSKNDFICQVLLYFIGGYLIISGELSFGTLILVIGIYNNLFLYFDELVCKYNDFKKAMPYFENIIISFQETECESQKLYIESIIGNNISLKFHNRVLFNSINFKFEANKKYLIVGENGCGKSTLVLLLKGLIANYEGSLKLNNREVNDILRRQMKKNIYVIWQDSKMFNLSIMENLKLANNAVKEHEVVEACKMVFAHEWISELPDQYNTLIGESAENISGGQYQQLILSRMILSNPDFIIIDEGMKWIDKIKKQQIQERLEIWFRGKTLISIAHEEEFWKYDTLLFFKGGKLYE